MAVPRLLPVPGIGTVLGLGMAALAAAMWRGQSSACLPRRVAELELPRTWAQRVLGMLASAYCAAGRFARRPILPTTAMPRTVLYLLSEVQAAAHWNQVQLLLGRDAPACDTYLAMPGSPGSAPPTVGFAPKDAALPGHCSGWPQAAGSARAPASRTTRPASPPATGALGVWAAEALRNDWYMPPAQRGSIGGGRRRLHHRRLEDVERRGSGCERE